MTGFHEYFIKVILKSEPWRTKLKKFKKSQCTYVRHALIRSFDSSAPGLSSEYRVGEVNLRHLYALSSAGDRQIPKCTDPFTAGQNKDYILVQKISIFFKLTPRSGLRPDLEASGCRS